MGKYVRVWIYSDNEKYLQKVDNIGKTVNNALAFYSTVDGIGKEMLADGKISVSRADSPVFVHASPIYSNSITCNSGHMLLNGTGKCISKACKYGK